MLNAIKREANRSLTENGAVTHASSGSYCLDLFASVGALRRADEKEVVARFMRAYAENADLAMKLLFFARDVRGGLGERRVFRLIVRHLAYSAPQSILKNLEYFAFFGRFDDMLELLGTPCENRALALLKRQLDEDIAAAESDGTVSLLAKWLPSVNASKRETVTRAKKLCAAFGMSQAQYRKTLTALRAKIKIIENNLRERDYSFDYSKQPSRAMFKYRQAFYRNDAERYANFLRLVSEGEQTLHADNVAPYELCEPYLRGWAQYNPEWLSEQEKESLNAAWQSLPDYGNYENALAVVDTSGSMYYAQGTMPAAVAFSLGLYLAEHNRGEFKNCFIEFSEKPQLIELKGETFVDRLHYAASFNRIANTNLEAVFELVLRAALKNGVPQSELPKKLIIISDMEFDMCVDNCTETVFENAKRRYAEQGYTLPNVVFWNAASRKTQVPVTMNEQGVALVSGVTPRLFQMVAGELASPYELMLQTLNSERYSCIAA